MPTRKELLARAKQLGLSGCSSLKKYDILIAIEEKEKKLVAEHAVKSIQREKELRSALVAQHLEKMALKSNGTIDKSIADERQVVSRTLLDFDRQYAQLASCYETLREAAATVVAAHDYAQGDRTQDLVEDALASLRFVLEHTPTPTP